MRRFLRVLVAAAAVGFLSMVYVYLTVPDVRQLATTNPTTTAFMKLRARQAAAQGRELQNLQRWVPYSRISSNLKRAVLVAEDSGFWEHEGIDVQQIRASLEIDLERGNAVRGASTITQQLAKNLFLSPSRNPIRKLRELIIARRLEAALPKVRIFEIYLNVIEWGDGVWGAEAAARRYFGVPASALNPEQAALLAGAIINPRVLNPSHPSARLLRRQRVILRQMSRVTPPAAAPVLTVSPIAPPVQAEPPMPDTPAVPPGTRPPVEPAPPPPPNRPPS